MSESHVLVDLQKICVDLQGKPILSGVDMQVNAREILTLIGPNGAGKTTLLRVALGLLSARSGSVRKKPGLRIGYVPQKLHPDQSFPLSVYRFLSLSARRITSRIPAVLKEVGAEDLSRAQLSTLSGGELQRILLARALLRDPELLVLDEPVQGVDVHGQVELFQLITHLRDKRDCAVLMVSHDLHLVMASTDRVICLNRHVCCTGSPEVVSQDLQFLKLFGPAALPHLALYSHDTNHRHEECDGTSCRCPRTLEGETS
ncbi:MAG TPA: metal ABC transporter ATP-binding protein [Geopsychrobacteraceae bacterium]|nr:metal ABC transporter ATP-binding protein [Geopsychrobacteraceae bacterium]